MNFIKLLWEKGKKEKFNKEAAKLEKEQPKKTPMDVYVEKLMNEEMAKGFDEETAKKRVARKIARKVEKHRSQGTLIKCFVCGKAGVNSESGGMKLDKLTSRYYHQNCEYRIKRAVM